MKERLDQLEASILELGSEVYQLRTLLGEVREQNSAMRKMIQALEGLLDEKRLILEEEVELAMDQTDPLGVRRENDLRLLEEFVAEENEKKRLN